MEPSNVRKLSPEDRDKLVLQLEREEADLTERDYDRYQELIKRDLSGLTAKKIVQSYKMVCSLSWASCSWS